MLGLGGYKIGNGPTCLARTKTVRRIFNAAAKSSSLGFEVIDRSVTGNAANRVLKFFGGASKLCPPAGNIDYLAAHGKMMFSKDGKPILTIVQDLNKPIRTFLADNLSHLFKALKGA